MPALELERDGHLATLWLANGRNAMGLDFFDELPLKVAEIDADDDIRVVILTSRSQDFSVGLDLKGGLGPEFMKHLQGGLAGERRELYKGIARLQAGFRAVHDSPKPFIAAVDGWCIGGGLDLISACDLRHATHRAQFSLRETRIAMVADLGSLQRLPAIIGQGNIRDLAFTGRDLDAGHAKEMGLLNSLHENADTMLAAVREQALAIAANSPLAVQGCKHILNHMQAETEDRGLDYVALYNASQLASADFLEAFTAFVEKRPPVFKGQ